MAHKTSISAVLTAGFLPPDAVVLLFTQFDAGDKPMASTKEHKAKTVKQVIYIYSFSYFVSGVVYILAAYHRPTVWCRKLICI